MVTLVMTMIPLTNADSFMPRMSSSDSTSTMNSAGHVHDAVGDHVAGGVVHRLERRVATRRMGP